MITKADITLIKSLAKSSAREESGLFLVEGAKMVEEALESGMIVRRVIGTERFAQIPNIELVSQKQIERMSHLQTTQGVLALVEKTKDEQINISNKGLVLMLDGVQDPGNLGTIIRVADWFGIEQVICSTSSADCFNPKVVQATMGSIFRVKIHYTELGKVLEDAIAMKKQVYGTFMQGENIYEAELSADGVIVMGSEGQGVSEQVERLIGRKLYIPPYPIDRDNVESLNVATATAIICSEFRRQSLFIR